MTGTLEEMIKNYVEEYMKSEKGQRSILISMMQVLNNKNLEKLNELFSKSFIKGLFFKDLKNIICEFENLLSSKMQIASVKQIKTIHEAIVQISELLNKIEYEKTTDAIISNYIDKIYDSVSNFNLSPRMWALEDILALNFSDSDIVNNVSYTTPERAQESKLKKYGYSVAWNSPLSNKKRQDLLKYLIKSGEVSKGYVISYLKHNIQINGKKKANEFAVMKWQDDLDFVNKL